MPRVRAKALAVVIVLSRPEWRLRPVSNHRTYDYALPNHEGGELSIQNLSIRALQQDSPGQVFMRSFSTQRAESLDNRGSKYIPFLSRILIDPP